MDLVTASQVRLPIAVELSPGDVRLACEIVRLSNGRIVWCEYARLIEIRHAQYTLHVLGGEPTGEIPEWRVDDLRFFLIGRNDESLAIAWQGYETNRIRNGTNRVIRCTRQFGETEYGYAPEASAV